MALSKAQLKILRRLKQKKYRYLDKKFTAEGNKLVNDLMEAGWRPDDIYAHDEVDLKLFPGAELISKSDRKLLSSQDNPSGVLAVFRMPEIQHPDELDSSALALYGVQDPGNMGTIIRTAAWFGFTQLVLLDGCVDPFNEKAVQASMGSIAHINLIVAPNAYLEKWKADGFNLLAADMQGDDVYAFDWPKKWLLLMGNEGQGLKGLPTDCQSITIPSLASNGPESLNVSIATAVILSAMIQKMRL